MPGTTTVTAASTLARLLKSCQKETEAKAAKCPENRRFAQIAPGKATPLWLVGHLASAGNFLGNTIGLNIKGLITPEFRNKFNPAEFGGGPITTNPADYPSWEEVLDNYRKVMTALHEGVATIPDEELLGPPRGNVPEGLKKMISTLQDAITINIMHDSHHRGQLAMLANRPD